MQGISELDLQVKVVQNGNRRVENFIITACIEINLIHH